jgi:hypothetical protein
LAKPTFPAKFLRRSVLAAALLLHGTRVRPYGYAFALATEFHHYYAAASGHVATRTMDAHFRDDDLHDLVTHRGSANA